MIDITNKKSNTQLYDWLYNHGCHVIAYNRRVIECLRLLDRPENYANPCWNCGSNHTIYDNYRVTERDVRNLDTLIERGGTLILNNISVSNDREYHDKRGFYCLVYYRLAERIDEILDDNTYRQTYVITEIGKQFAEGKVSIPAYYAMKDGMIVDRSNNKRVFRHEVFENKFCMKNVVECNKKTTTRYIPFDKRELGDTGYIDYSTSYAIKHGKNRVLNKMKSQHYVTEAEIFDIMQKEFNKSNPRDIIYSLLDDGYFIGYDKTINAYCLLMKVVRSYDIDNTVKLKYYEKGEPIINELRRLGLNKRTINLIYVHKYNEDSYKYDRIYERDIFMLYDFHVDLEN